MAALRNYIGDSTDLSISLLWQSAAFEPGGDWALLFTAKYNVDDDDSDAVIQKATGAGLTVSGSVATLSLVPDDTSELSVCNLVWAIKATHITLGTVRTVAAGSLKISRGAAHESVSSITIYTAEEAVPFARTADETHAATSKTTPVDADEIPLVDSAASWGLKKLTWANLKATLKTYFDTLYATIGSGGSWGSITGTLSSQIDLNSALSAKAPLVSPSFTTPTLGAAKATSISDAIGTFTVFFTENGITLQASSGTGPGFAVGINGSTANGSLAIQADGSNFPTTISSTATANRSVTFPDAAGTIVLDTATQTLTNKTLTSPTLTSPAVTGYTESVVAIGTVTTSHTLALTNGTFQTATLTASTACTFTMPAVGAGKSFILHLKQAASTGNGTATFTGVKWSGGTAPTITATAAKMDILSFTSDGTNWYGSFIQNFTP